MWVRLETKRLKFTHMFLQVFL